MKVLVKNQNLEDITCDALVVNIFEEEKNLSKDLLKIDKTLNGLIKNTIKDENFKGKLGSTLVIKTNNLIKAKKIILLGLGKKAKFDITAFRKACASAIRKAKAEKVTSLGTALHKVSVGKIQKKDLAQIITEVSQLAIYDFDKYKSKDKKDDPKIEIENLFIIEDQKANVKGLESGVEKGNLNYSAQKLARDLVSEPANIATPTHLANLAKKIATENKLKIKILDEDDCKKLGMGAFIGVGKGSKEPLKFIELKYTPKKKTKKHIAIVGKGITFDSGGLSLKPSNSMETMKMDMSGAAAVLGTMSVINKLSPSVAVTAIVAACENMPGGNAYKLGDVLTAMNGKTIEILNTDAEGRVTLADSLSYIAREKPNEIVDLATLTGACVVALGDTSTGVMTNNQKLAEKIIKAGNEVGERMWQLPLVEEDREKIKSEVADMINTGSKGSGGAQNGAVFLENFVDNIPWVHLDIAGTAWISTANSFGSKGPTGVGARTLINYLDKYSR